MSHVNFSLHCIATREEAFQRSKKISLEALKAEQIKALEAYRVAKNAEQKTPFNDEACKARMVALEVLTGLFGKNSDAARGQLRKLADWEAMREPGDPETLLEQLVQDQQRRRISDSLLLDDWCTALLK